jgi:K+-transporting ATPase ATPase C chain
LVWRERKTIVIAHLRALAILTGLTVGLCCFVYPLILWGVGRLFPHQASGSLIEDEKGVHGSRLLAQPFSEPRYFQPRPSAVGYNAAASGASNLAVSNPKLRGQVAQRLGLIARYKTGPRKGDPVGPDVEKWFLTQVKEKNRNPTEEWAKANPSLASDWAGSSDLVKAYVLTWAKQHPDALAAWKKANPDKTEPTKSDVGDLAGDFFTSYSKVHPGTFPGETEEKGEKGEPTKVIRPVTEGDEIRSYFFDMWLTENPEKIDPLVDLEQVPADLVTTSGSGLDPHITLRGARYQLDRVVEARAKDTGRSPEEVKKTIERVLEKQSFRPLGGLAGESLVNVLEVNRELDAELKPISKNP